MVRHFKTKQSANKFQREQTEKRNSGLHTFRKLKGHKNRVQKPFVVCTEFEWLNLD